MVNDPISDMLIRIKNAYLARHRQTQIPYSRLKENLGDILVRTRFLKDLKVESIGLKKYLIATLKYEGKHPTLTDVAIVSKPSLRIYVSRGKIPRVLGGLGICILSTSKGLMTGKEALGKKLGGELLCKIW